MDACLWSGIIRSLLPLPFIMMKCLSDSASYIRASFLRETSSETRSPPAYSTCNMHLRRIDVFVVALSKYDNSIFISSSEMVFGNVLCFAFVLR